MSAKKNDTPRKRGKRNYFRILSIDGGGIRGIIPAAVLTAVEAAIQGKTGNSSLKIGDCFDLIAGTSTGGILTCLFLAPDGPGSPRARFSARDALDFYLEYGDDIFDQSIWQKIVSVNGLADEKYSAAMLEKVLKNHFGDLKLSELIRPCLITAYNTKMYQPFFFTQHDALKDKQREYYVRDAARATSAAPTYFETALAENLDNIPNAQPMIDGGVFANNPAACAFVEALEMKKSKSFLPSNIAMLSLGTGRKPKKIAYEECRNWGLAGWARPLVGILMEGVSQTVDYQMATVFRSLGVGSQYLRIDGEFGDYRNNLDIEGLDANMDNASRGNMQRLERFGQQLAQNFSTKITTFVNAHF